MSFDRTTVKKRPFLMSAVATALALAGSLARGGCDMPEVAPTSGCYHRPFGPPEPSYRSRPNQRQRRKAARQAAANGF